MIEETLFDAEEKMEKAVSHAREDFQSIRTGRANPAMFSKVVVDYYGSPTPLVQLAGFQQPDARTLVITPFDKVALKEIERAIVAAPLLDSSSGCACTAIIRSPRFTPRPT